MRPTVSQYAEALEALSQEGGLSAISIARNLVGFLKRRGESDKTAAIVQSLEKRATVKDGRLVVTVTTAHELSPETKIVLTKKAESLFPGKKIDFLYEIESAMIGGVSFRTDEMLYDATIATELRSLQQVLHK